jgi:hypothetical protein
MKKTILFLFVLLIFNFATAQSAGPIKYAVIPSKFDFQKTADQYGLSSLTKMFFQKLGYAAYFDTETMPPEVADQNCNTVYVSVVEDNAMLTTKLKVLIKDCRNNIIITSVEGKSKEKEYKAAYTEALRKALKSIEGASFKPSLIAAASGQKIVPNQPTPTKSPISVDSQVLNAQAIPNGFQLVNTTPKIVLRIFTTSEADVYIAADETTSGVVFKDGPLYTYEYYSGDKLVRRQLNIKF